MRELDQVKKITTDVINSYDERICAVEEIIEKSLEMLDQYRVANQMVQESLRETLAKVESLRKKDFDSLMAPLLVHQEDRQREIKLTLHSFLKRQRELAAQLKRVVQAGIFSNIPPLEKAIEDSIAQTRVGLKCFQDEQALIGEKMQYLFHKKDELTLREFKKTIDSLSFKLGLETTVPTDHTHSACPGRNGGSPLANLPPGFAGEASAFGGEDRKASEEEGTEVIAGYEVYPD